MPDLLDGAPDQLAILRLSAIGDTCHVVPVLRTLQAVWPETAITWIIGRTEATLLGDLPGVEFVSFDKREGRQAYRKLLQQMRGRHYDVLLHLQAALRASIASLCIPARLRLGYDRARAKDFQWLFTNARIQGEQRVHVMDSMFAFLEALGIKERVLRWDIPIPLEAQEFAERELPPGRLLVISPCSSARWNNFRNWPAERYAAVAEEAMRKHDFHIVLTGGGTELERWYGEEIARRMTRKPLDLIGRTSLKQLLAVLQRADVLVSPDSGPVHMATTVGTPVIGLYASSNPLRTGPYLSQQWVVNRYPEAVQAAFGKSVEELPWGKRVRDPDVMERILVDDVLERRERLVAAGLPRTLPPAQAQSR